MPRSRHSRVRRLEEHHRILAGHGLDVSEMTDQQLETVIGIPGLNVALDQMPTADAEHILELLIEAPNDNYDLVKNMILR